MSCAENQPATSERIVSWLRCPFTHAPLTVTGSSITCPTSDFRGSIRDDVAVMLPEDSGSFFDDKFQVMTHGADKAGEWDFCYRKQTQLLTDSLAAGTLVVDIGCGPALPYRKPAGVNLAGLDPSFQSIRVNRSVDLRVFGTANAMPFADASVDRVVCFYAIHHMVGPTVTATMANIARAFGEFARVLKPGGALWVFEMTPNPGFWAAQRLLWNPVKRRIPDKLDMHFFSAAELAAFGTAAFPAGHRHEVTEFHTSPFTFFAPIFSLPKLKVPRFIYPLGSRLYTWRMPQS
jgi:ubiquinone/menaquinone biosynthesis C-methylase UbiE